MPKSKMNLKPDDFLFDPEIQKPSLLCVPAMVHIHRQYLSLLAKEEHCCDRATD